MNSIRKKFTVLNLTIIFLCTFIVGGAGLWFTSRSQKEYSDEILQLTCRQETSFLNDELTDIQRAIDVFAEQATDRIPPLETVGSDMAVRRQYISEMEKLIGGIARYNKSVLCYYLRLAPEVADEASGEVGFFYTKKKRVETFIKQPLTRIQDFDPSDREHVGWYYAPKESGRPLWLEPYYNKNIDMDMISYVAPLYKDGKFVGVVGMDMDFGLIVNDVSVISPYKTGYTSLVSREGKIYYHPVYEPGTNITDYSGELKELIGDMKYYAGKSRTQTKTYSYTHQGKEKKLVFSRLQNDMVLLLSVEADEIEARQNTMFRITAIAAVVMALLAALINLVVSSRITKPLKALTEAAEQIAEGNLDVELPKPTNDEVGRLTRSFDVTVQSLKKYISGMRYKAYSDPLTHVKNKNAYELEKERLERQMRAGGAKYAFLMLDTNDLKKVNDAYGHDRGDDYLLNCCQMICRVFEHSPVFRIGGDEFLVLLENGDYERRDELVAEFNRRSEESLREPYAWNRVSAAKGLAVCEPSDTSPEDVLRRADHAMYHDKKAMKENG